MCLLVTQPEGTTWDADFIKGVYLKNRDGVGVMYAENNTLHTVKLVPHTLRDFENFFAEDIQGKACAWHARMQTHGDIDITNCHPYQVLDDSVGYPLCLMHNGVLHTDNRKDVTKSDTWHYIRDYLRPMLEKNPEFFLTPAFADLVGTHIHNNRFVLLDAYGSMVTVNEYQGVEYNGAWLSNTYAWDTTGTEHEPKRWKNSWSNAFTSSRYEPFSYDKSAFSDSRRVDSYEDDDDGADNNLLHFVSSVFDSLYDAGMSHAANILTTKDVENYFHGFGAGAWDVIDLIGDEAATDDDIIEEIRLFNMAAA